MGPFEMVRESQTHKKCME